MASAIRARSSDMDLALGSHTGPRHVNRRIRGRTHGSTRPFSVRVRRFFLHQRRQSLRRFCIHQIGSRQRVGPRRILHRRM